MSRCILVYLKAKARFSPSFWNRSKKEKAKHVLSGGATFAECGRGFHLHLQGSVDLIAPSFQNCLPEQPSGHNESYSIKTLCHWVSKSYLTGREVIWSHSSLFKNGALPHQFVFRGLVMIEGGNKGSDVVKV